MRYQVGYTLREGGKVRYEVVEAVSKEEADEVIWMTLDTRGKELHEVKSVESLEEI